MACKAVAHSLTNCVAGLIVLARGVPPHHEGDLGVPDLLFYLSYLFIL